MTPSTLQAICRLPCQGADPSVLSPSVMLPAEVASRLAAHLRLQHYSPLRAQERVLVALADQVLNMSSAQEQPQAAAVCVSVWEAHSSLTGVPLTLQRVGVLLPPPGLTPVPQPFFLLLCLHTACSLVYSEPPSRRVWLVPGCPADGSAGVARHSVPTPRGPRPQGHRLLSGGQAGGAACAQGDDGGRC